MHPTRRFASRAIKKAVVKTGDAQGTSGAIFVATLAGEEYLVKAKSLCDSVGPFIPANELIAIELAEQLGIPVLGWDFVELQDGDVGFGLRRMKNAEFGRLNSKMLGLLAEPDLLSAIGCSICGSSILIVTTATCSAGSSLAAASTRFLPRTTVMQSSVNARTPPRSPRSRPPPRTRPSFTLRNSGGACMIAPL